MPCVNDHPDFLKMAAEWANPQIAALLSEQAMLLTPAIPHAHAHHEHGHAHHH